MKSWLNSHYFFSYMPRVRQYYWRTPKFYLASQPPSTATV